ncbi:MAG TPA: LEA type 2 family protein [Thermoanaerobaculia bacterium]|jgi:LEA14-like dessication related protein|nr:LEA type 2 family protein [Thermoanaerobaculia bacterium]
MDVHLRGNSSFHRAAAVLTVLAALSFTACAGLGGLGNVVQPQVDVTDVRVLGTTLTGADLLFQFRVDNPNAVALVLDAIGYRLRLNGQPLLDGRRDQETRIAANGRSVVELPVTIRYEDVYRVIRSFENRSRPDYALDADFRFEVPILGAVTVPVSKRGEIPLDRLRVGK